MKVEYIAAISVAVVIGVIILLTLVTERGHIDHLTGGSASGTELLPRAGGITLSPHISDIRYWPYYHYTLPYQYLEGGAWPPNMYTRMTHWQPGYDIHGWSTDMRPGMGYVNWPRNRWVRKVDGVDTKDKNSSYYYIDNGSLRDRPGDYYKGWGSVYTGRF